MHSNDRFLADTLIAWQKQYGRHDLPWQNTCDPYAIWVSEIMLQQTQVSAVSAYYQRFMLRFPTIANLAQAEQDEVMQYWSGLGYYSRARNLHHSAKIIMRDYGGEFPNQFEHIMRLKGIGRSTASAIAVFAFNQRYAILDGNVKRVFSRYFAIVGWPGTSHIEQQLWQLAEQLLPSKHLQSYTQGLMDFGATLCTRSKPSCNVCPLHTHCLAYQQRRVAQLPTPKPPKALPIKSVTMLVMVCDGQVLLQKRPNQGIWGGLWSLPETGDTTDELALVSALGLQCKQSLTLTTMQHSFTHYKLNITAQLLQITRASKTLAEGWAWMPLQTAIMAGIPTPVRLILKAYAESSP